MLHKIHKAIESFGGAKRDRTADLCNAIAALSQLSYSPIAKRSANCEGNAKNCQAKIESMAYKLIRHEALI